ncbi:glycerate kinase [Mucilaginibacter auburnensis]|uniref:Glycerate kinase n=1 Tax=Mucilaginibacter auburnensis TaxID=1457233 RepID=A0A2H9VLY0_9SPHI|nr:glycerate kinase [Mucilaginibacter auburnensis]PJJ79349.1 glycerate kinase [Mucilaginibacter auburnensis]
MAIHVLIAPNAFKNSVTATEVAEALQKGLHQSGLHCNIECFPIADGGDGTGSLIMKKCHGELVNCVVNDPLGRPIEATIGLIDRGKTAVIEMADASGLRLLAPDELNPMQTSSLGTGQMMKLALDRGVNKIILAMGGSASVDGGCGILNALGVTFLDEEGNILLKPTPENLKRLANIDLRGLDPRIAVCEIVVLCDVDSQLLGKDGAAAIYGPQKGATEEMVQQLDSFLTNFAAITLKTCNININTLNYGGAAGGATSGVHAYLNARLVNGISYFLQLTEFDKSLQNASVVITGEGSIDSQTLQGKGPFGVAALAKQRGLPVIAVAGKVPLEDDEELRKYFDILLAIGNEPADMETAISNTYFNLVRIGTDIGHMLKLNSHV